ncbi:MAG TPA: hypothetical protein DC024_03045, partial [Clostridiales bacterium]|nr:hypothetical protein [Clostridiales bacterium]
MLFFWKKLNKEQMITLLSVRIKTFILLKSITIMRLLLTNIILAFFIVTSFGQKTKSYDVVVYGGTSAGIASAIQSS